MTPSPALPREGQPGIPGQVRDHQTARADCALTVREARPLPPLPISDGYLWLHHGRPVNAFSSKGGAEYPRDKWDWDGYWANKGFDRAPFFDADTLRAYVLADRAASAPQPLTEQRIDALAKQHLKAFAQFVGAGEVTYEGEQEFARAIEAELGVMPATPRRDAADTEPHGPNELNPAPAPGESADPQSQGDTQ